MRVKKLKAKSERKSEKSYLLGCFLLFCWIGLAQKGETQIEIQPYLQDAEPTSVKVMWQTNRGDESIVEYGPSPKLGKKTSGKSFDINYTDKRVHEVKLTGLERFTIYYYRVRTDKAVSDIYQFKTPPFSKERPSFRMVAMSDMQRDHNYPEKFQEVVDEGIIKYFDQEYGGALPENLALVLVPGDLVDNGSDFRQWKEQFFNPAENLFSQVPVYPALGNHEVNSAFYFKYFSLPQNGTPAYHGHWWYKDYGNTRIIGLNSNEGYRSNRQLEWLDRLLRKTADNDNIDFVFAQMHHPHKSELWIPGETDFSGKIVEKLEAFTKKTGKPSIHFFGHTHGYSRGQSKEHKHLWINVASAGGAIDNWGEFEGKDYEEFSVTQDEYGFVVVEVDGDENDPNFTVKRISQGNQKKQRDNELTDSITVFKSNRKPMAPTDLSPSNVTVAPEETMLSAGRFESDQPRAFHAASHWQLAPNETFQKPILDRWKQHENWYYEENRQKDDDLTDEQTFRLRPNRTYYWRVRYRDQNLNWSDWSEVASFKTGG